MKYISMFSGIEAASVAWHPLGWEPLAFAEIEPFPSAVLAHHFPDVPNLGDITTVDWSAYRGAAELVVGGSPCQSFSVAGLRKGLADPRGNLALEYLRAVDGISPRWVVWENVPGVLSADGGRAFGAFLGGLAQLGYGFAYRVLDAQYVRVESHARAVPQRRRRVFVVGCLGDWRSAAAVLFERESVRGNPAPRREAGAGVAALTSCGVGASGPDDNQAQAGHLIPEVSNALCSNDHKGSKADKGLGQPLITEVAHTLRAEYDASEDGTGRGTPIVMAPAFSKRPGQQIATKEDGGCFALTTGEPPRVLAVRTAQTSANGHGIAENVAHTLDLAQGQAVAFSGGNSGDAYGIGLSVEHTPPLRAAESGTNQVPTIQQGYAVRRLTPLECERLQGFPDGWTQVPYRGKQASDGPRYKAIGNSMAVNVMRFIGERIEAVRQNAPATCEGVQACDDVQLREQVAR